LDEAQASYKPEIVWQLVSNTVDDIEQNMAKIQQWMSTWVAPAELPPIPPKGARADDMDDDY
jgi:uncharacterized protein (DUF305 family)